ncbi:hypothetical protein B1964_09260, partial [Gordonia sp. i37]
MSKKKLTLRDLTNREREEYAIAIHEAGHAVMAVVLGDEVGSVTLRPTTRPTPETAHSPPNGSPA